MNKDTLERLCIDSHLGELDADVQELLEAYLHANEPDPRAETARVLDLATRVMAATSTTRQALPELRARAADYSLHPRPRSRVAPALAAAASIALAFFAGSRFGISGRDIDQPAPIAQAMPREQQSAPPFWSVAAYTSPRPQPQSNVAPIRWDSPLKLPQTGDRS